MRSVLKGVLAAGLLAGAGVGCQNSMYKENQDLRSQNIELQNQLEQTRREKAAQPAPVIAQAPAPVAPAVPAASITPRYEPPPTVTPEPAPAPEPKPDFGNLQVTQDVAAGTTTVNLPSDIFFTSGQAILQPEAKKSLAKVASVLKKNYSHKPIRIEGYTDSDPIKHSHWKSNEELSEKRAEAVRDYLVSKGVDASLVTTEGLGDKNPKSKTEKSKNRRVELVVITK